jgi:hypothetical protein
MIPRRAWIALSLACLVFAGCMSHRAPRSLESALEKQLGGRLERESGVKLGYCSTRILSAIEGREARDEEFSLGNITGLSVVTYTLHDGAAEGRRLDLHKLGLSDWEKVVQTQAPGEQVLVLAKTERGKLRRVMVLARDHDEIVVSEFRGDLDRLIEAVMRGAAEDGAHGARHPVEVVSSKK